MSKESRITATDTRTSRKWWAIPDPPVAVECPEWCTVGVGHSYDSVSKDRLEQRTHRLAFGDEKDGDVFVDVGTIATWVGEGEAMGPLDVQIWIEGNNAGPELTEEQARELGQQLIQAADFIAAHRA